MRILLRTLLAGFVVLLACDAGDNTSVSRVGGTAGSGSTGNSGLVPLQAHDPEPPPDVSTDFIAGWQDLGTCTQQNDMTGVNRDSVLMHLEIMRRHGLNTVRETASADGRIVARGTGRDSPNWYGYSYLDAEGRMRRTGHPRPGVFVEGMRWLLDVANGADGDPHVEVIVGLPRFVTPGYDAEPYSGSDVLGCDAYRDFIQAEIAGNLGQVRARIPRVQCTSAPARMPFWEWNIWYVVKNLSGHPGLRAWYLWDEPEGIAARHLFGVHQNEPPRFDGPESLPTTDLLRYVYRLVKEFDVDSNPVIVDIHSPHVFFSERFEWSTRADPVWSSGPFDVTPTGSVETPADILGLEASAYIVHPQATDEGEPHAWYWDVNHISRTSSMLADAARRDGKKAMVIAAQAQLPSGGPFAPFEPLRCEPNDATRTRLLNDRDLIWQLLTTHINGLYGYIYYSHALMPFRGPGAVQAQRSSRLLGQFLSAGLGDVLAQPDVDDRIRSVDIYVNELTDYYRYPPVTVGPPGTASKRAPNPIRSRSVSPEEFRVGRFNRSSSESDYGAPVIRENPYVLYPEHRLLRISLKRFGITDYLFISNAFDATITARVRFSTPFTSSKLSEGRFDLDRGGEFQWSRATDVELRPTTEDMIFEVDFGPYEARVFRIE